MHPLSRGWLWASTASPQTAPKADLPLPRVLRPEEQLKPTPRLDLNAAQHNLRKAFLPSKA